MARMWRNWNPCTLMVGDVKWCSHKAQKLYDSTYMKVLRAVKFREKQSGTVVARGGKEGEWGVSV